MIKHPDGRSLQGPGPLLHRGLRLDLIAGVFSELQQDKERSVLAGFLSLLGDKSCGVCSTWILKCLSLKGDCNSLPEGAKVFTICVKVQVWENKYSGMRKCTYSINLHI